MSLKSFLMAALAAYVVVTITTKFPKTILLK